MVLQGGVDVGHHTIQCQAESDVEEEASPEDSPRQEEELLQGVFGGDIHLPADPAGSEPHELLPVVDGGAVGEGLHG